MNEKRTYIRVGKFEKRNLHKDGQVTVMGKLAPFAKQEYAYHK